MIPKHVFLPARMVTASLVSRDSGDHRDEGYGMLTLFSAGLLLSTLKQTRRRIYVDHSTWHAAVVDHATVAATAHFPCSDSPVLTWACFLMPVN
jgi:hypothetical protein